MPLRLMPIGGSITHGVGSTDGNGYRKYLHDILLHHGYNIEMVGSRKKGSTDTYRHEGWRGFRIDQIKNKAKQCVETLRPNIFTVNAGSNDCVQNFQLSEVERRITGLVEYLWMASPRSTIILSTLLVNSDKEVDSRMVYTNDQICNVAEKMLSRQKKLVFVDMRSVIGPRMVDLMDGTHPNDEGYARMAQVWFRGFQEAEKKGLLSKLD